jgi:hypothetical protein
VGRHRAGTVASFAPEGLEALLPSVLERAFRGQLLQSGEVDAPHGRRS